MDDEDRPKPRMPEASFGAASLLAGESLESYSLDELDARVTLLEAEISRIKDHRDKAANHMRAAEDLCTRWEAVADTGQKVDLAQDMMQVTLRIAGETENVREAALVDRHRGFEIRFTFSEPARLWRVPVETVSLSEGGFERIYQMSTVLPNWRESYAPGEARSYGFRFEVTKL